jgi:hypothetical protein
LPNITNHANFAARFSTAVYSKSAKHSRQRSFISRTLLSIIMICFALSWNRKSWRVGAFRNPFSITRSQNRHQISTLVLRNVEKTTRVQLFGVAPKRAAGASPHERVSNGCTRAHCIQEKYDASYQHHRAESALRCRKPNGKPSGKRFSSACARRRTLNTRRRRHVLRGASVTTNFRSRAHRATGGGRMSKNH